MKTKVQRKSDFSTNKPKKNSLGTPPGSVQKGIKKPSLDIHANNSASPVITGISKGILDLYKLRDNAAKILPYMGICKCGKVPYRKYVTVSRNEKGVKRFGNVVHCASVWVCPTCAYKKSRLRQDQIRDIIKLHNNSGCSFYFVTLTIRHNINDPLTVLIHSLRSSWNQITKERLLKPLFKSANFIQCLEIRYSFTTGWSPHYHAVFMSPDKEHITPLFNSLIDSWTKKTGSEKKGQKVIEATDEESLSEYIAKISLANELTDGQIKISKKGKSVSYFDMLNDTVKYRKQIEEYAAATKGIRSLMKSKGLNIISDQEDQEDQEIDNLLNIHKAVYYATIVKNCDYKMILENVESWDWVRQYFKGFQINDEMKMINPKKGEKKQNNSFLNHNCTPEILMN